MKQDERIIQLDFLRVIAIVSVVIMHCTGAVQRYYSNGIDAVFLFTNIPNAITRFSVPLFVMISGRLMINRGYDYNYLLRKTAHYMLIFLFWSTLYSLILPDHMSETGNSLKAILVNTIADIFTGWFHFWYLFLICGLYLLIPIIESIVNHLSERNKRFFIAISVVFCFLGNTLMGLPFLKETFGDHLNGFLAGFTGIYVFYYLTG